MSSGLQRTHSRGNETIEHKNEDEEKPNLGAGAIIDWNGAMDGIPYGAGYWRLNVSCIALDNSSTSDSSSSSEKFKDGTNWDATNSLQILMRVSQLYKTCCQQSAVWLDCLHSIWSNVTVPLQLCRGIVTVISRLRDQFSSADISLCYLVARCFNKHNMEYSTAYGIGKNIQSISATIWSMQHLLPLISHFCQCSSHSSKSGKDSSLGRRYLICKSQVRWTFKCALCLQQAMHALVQLKLG